MTLAFQADTGLESTFGGYYLVPFGFAILILLSEIAVVEKSRALQEILLAGPIGLMLLALIPGDGNAYQLFRAQFTHALGSPLWLTVCGCFIFSVYFYCRHAEQKTSMIQALLLAMTFISPADNSMPTLFPQNWWPLLAVGALQFIILPKDTTASRFLKGWCSIVAALSIWGQGRQFTQLYGVIPWHILLLGVVLASLLFADDFAKWLRKRLPVLMFGLSLVAATAQFVRGDVRWLAICYVLVMVSVTASFWYWHKMKLWKWATFGCVCILGVILIGSRGPMWNIQSRSTQALLVGAVCFMLGGAISAAKAGLSTGISSRVRSEWEQLKVEWHS